MFYGKSEEFLIYKRFNHLTYEDFFEKDVALML
jgi:hypothetical protein